MNRVTWCTVRIVTPDTPLGPSRTFEWEAKGSGRTLDGLMGVNVQQSVDGLRNSFMLHFSPHRHNGLTWAEIIPLYSLVYIEMGSSEHEGDDPLVMIGVTKGDSHNSTFGQQVQREVVIQGEGIETVLWDANIWFAPYLDNNTAAANEALRRAVDAPTRNAISGNAQLQWTAEILGGKGGQAAIYDPREMLLGILRYFIADGATSVFSLQIPDRPLHRILVAGEQNGWIEQDIGPGGGPQLAQQAFIPKSWSVVDERIRMAFSQYRPEPGPIAQHCEKIVDRTFHDFFVRYEGGRARLVHRVKPFNTQQATNRVIGGMPGGPSLFNLNAVNTVEIQGHDLRQASLSRSMPINNFFYVLPGFHSADGKEHMKAAFAPAFCTSEDFSNIARFGLRPLDTVSPYLVLDRQTEGDETTPEEAREIGTIIELARKFSNILKVWMDPHPVMWAGTLSIRGRVAIRPGDRVVWNGNDVGPFPIEFHVRSVAHTYSFADGSFITSLNVERGWRIGGGINP